MALLHLKLYTPLEPRSTCFQHMGVRDKLVLCLWSISAVLFITTVELLSMLHSRFFPLLASPLLVVKGWAGLC